VTVVGALCLSTACAWLPLISSAAGAGQGLKMDIGGEQEEKENGTLTAIGGPNISGSLLSGDEEESDLSALSSDPSIDGGRALRIHVDVIPSVITEDRHDDAAFDIVSLHGGRKHGLYADGHGHELSYSFEDEYVEGMRFLVNVHSRCLHYLQF
jgi:prepilin-type processing-associated H-X9-DG protein